MALLPEDTELKVYEPSLHILDDGLISPLDWFHKEPPYLLPQLPFTKEYFMALVFFKLGNHTRALQYLDREDALYDHLLCMLLLLNGQTISRSLEEFVIEASLHNGAIIKHLGITEEPPSYEEVRMAYEQALHATPHEELKAYTVKQYADLLFDAGEIDMAITLVREAIPHAISEDAILSLKSQLASFLMASAVFPLATEEAAELDDLQHFCIGELEKKGLWANAGLLLMDAAELASLRKEFPEAKTYVNRAIQHFRKADIEEFMAEATMQKGIVLYNWSKYDSPQYYKPAVAAFQDALKVFKRHSHPQRFADIHHHMALIYSEMPAQAQEKAIWTAFSASSFKNAMEFYTKEVYPYEYASVVHNYATALMYFPPAKLHNNFDKAASFFEEALTIREAARFPVERALSLLNQIELLWMQLEASPEVHSDHTQKIKAKAEEVLKLTTQDELVEKAKGHLKEIDTLNVSP